MIPLFSNLLALRRHHPAIAAKLDACTERENLIAFNTPDGGVAYGIKRDGSVTPLTDPTAPLARIGSQLDRFAAELSNFTKPVLIVGLNPGDELLHIFDLSDKAPPPHATQHIHVCIDSLPCLHAFLSAFDATRVLNSPRVHFFLLDDAQAYADEFRAHPEWPHLFTPISGSLNGSVPRVAGIFGALVQERDAEYRRLIAENNAYYDAISDEELTAVIAGQDKEEEKINHGVHGGTEAGKDQKSVPGISAGRTGQNSQHVSSGGESQSNPELSSSSSSEKVAAGIRGTVPLSQPADSCSTPVSPESPLSSTPTPCLRELRGESSSSEEISHERAQSSQNRETATTVNSSSSGKATAVGILGASPNNANSSALSSSASSSPTPCLRGESSSSFSCVSRLPAVASEAKEGVSRATSSSSDSVSESPSLSSVNSDSSDSVSESSGEAASAKTDSASAPRRPRLLLPTSAWSTVTQYAARDLAEMLRGAGWDVLHLNIDSMMTPYLMARTIHDFKPDVLLFINHLRTECLEAYPRNLLFVTWVQDTVPQINNRETGAAWAKMAMEVSGVGCQVSAREDPGCRMLDTGSQNKAED